MRSQLSVDEYALLDFFSDSPTQEDPYDPWEYNDSVYQASDEVTKVSFAIAPAFKDIRILLTVSGEIVFEFDAVGVADVRYHNEKRRKSLEVIITASQSIWLSIQPRILIRQSTSDR